MALQSLVHPTAETLAAFNCGALTAGERSGIEDHILACDTCCSALAGLSEDRLVGLARKAASDLPPTAGMIDIPDVPPELIDHPRYHVLSQLGAGGMGVVYKAEHRLMGRIVALKIVARRYTSNPAAVERFRREFRAAARLNHPNIVTAHDADEANGLHFLVMEYVEGISLDRLVRKKGPLPVATACQCIRQAALGLQHAFERKMVHRDIKPHNLMVTRKGQVKVLDFGLARVAAESALPALDAGTDHPDRTVTSASTVMGTPDYLAPEQARNSHDVDIRADIYALGCVFYFLLSGRAPFASQNTPLGKMLAHTQDEPESIRKLRPEVPADLLRVLERMMAKNPNERFATPGEVATELKSFTRAEAIVDVQPFIVSTPMAQIVEAPTSPLAFAPTIKTSRVRPAKRKAAKKNGSSKMPLFVAGAVVATLLVGVGLVAAFGGFNKDRGTSTTPGGKTDPVTPVVSAKRIIFVVPNRGVHHPDYWPVKDRLTKAGLQVVTVSTSLDECEYDELGGRPTRPVKPDRLIGDVLPSEYDGVIFCGANVSEFLKWDGSPGYAAASRIVADLNGKGKIVAAICTGQRVLLELPVARGKTMAATNWPQLKAEHFTFKGANPSNDPVVIDRNMITASGPTHAVPFADAIIAALR